MGQRTMEKVCGLVIPISGKARFTIENQVFEIEPGKILHAGPDMKLDKEVVGDMDWHYVLLHYRILMNGGKVFNSKDYNYVLNTGIGQYPQLYNYTDQLKRSQENSSNMNMLKNKRLLYGLIEQILQLALEREMGVEDEPIQQIVSYIHQNIEKNITVFELAEMMNMDAKRFYYIFQKDVGMCPKKYITKCRIKKAKELLIKEQYSISEIADMVGYEDAFQFSRMFKKNMGVAPSLFRDNFGKNS
jgi:AraC-like DNA-binding protein